MILEVTIPEKVSLNRVYAGIHWAKRKALADLYHREFFGIKNLKVEEYPVVILYDFHWTKNPLDSLNCALLAKMLEDGMVNIGILEDDSPKYVRESRLRTEKSNRFKHDTVIINITTIKDGKI